MTKPVEWRDDRGGLPGISSQPRLTCFADIVSAITSLADPGVPENRAVCNNFRVPLRKLFLWLSVYACLFAIVAGFPTPNVQIAAAIVILTAFVIMDVRWQRSTETSSPALARSAIVVAYYATAFVVSVVVCFGLFLLLPEPPAPPKPPLPFLAALYHIASGQLFADIGQAIGKVLLACLIYYGLFAVFSTAGFLSSLFGLRHFGSAKWFALINFPGAAMFTCFVIAAIFDSSEP